MEAVFSSISDLHTTPLDDESTKVDVDDGNSWSCSACTLPIFSTPFNSFQTGNSDKYFMHHQCANDLPKELISHPLHPRKHLILKENQTDHYCRSCRRKCGSKLYECPHVDCDFALDLLCALQIKISHRSHPHELMVIRAGSAKVTCGACGTDHHPGGGSNSSSTDLYYMCSPCDFWVHPDCALSPNAITLLHPQAKHDHHHSLFLTYPRKEANCICGICQGGVQNSGAYFCANCNYYAHIQCTTSDPQSFKPVLIRDAKFSGLLHFPLADEWTSVVRHIRENADSRSSDEAETVGKLLQESLHQHPLTFHGKDEEEDQGQSSRVCNACIQRILPPFYSCSECPDFFLHNCCANLPSKINHPMHPSHALFLFPKAPKLGIFLCDGCFCNCNGFVYSCNDCNINMDVVCALLPPSIIHDPHSTSHVLYRTLKQHLSSLECSSCDFNFPGLSYECSLCRSFALDARCALLPKTVHHKFDEHPLKLITITNKYATAGGGGGGGGGAVCNREEWICEICELKLKSSVWHYSCSQCDQSFHRDCIAAVQREYSMIKFGATIQVDCHNCPLSLILERTVGGYHCSYCLKTFDYSPDCNKLAYECSKCYDPQILCRELPQKS